MATNPFDETLEAIDDEQQTAAPSNPFDEVVRQQDTGRERSLRAAAVETQTAEPDRAADVLRLARGTGIAPAIVERNFDAIKKRATIENTPFEAIMRETPALAEFISEPANLAVVKDDLEQLGAIEWLLTAPGRSVARGIHQLEVGKLRSASLYRELTQEEHDRLNTARFYMNEGGALGVGDSWFKGAIVGTAGQLPILFGATLQGAKRAPIGAGTGAAIGGAAGAMAGGIGAGPGALAGATFGATRGMAIGAAEFAFQVEAGLALDEMLTSDKYRDELGNQIDPNAATAAAIGVGLVNAGLEVVGLEVLAKTIPGISKLKGAMTRKAVESALRSPTARHALAEAGKLYATTVAKETAIEVGQRAVTILGAEAAKLQDGGEFEELEVGDVAADLANEAAGALQSFALMSLPGPTLTATIDVRRAREAAQNVDFFKALGGAVTSSKTLERMPEAMQAFVEQATKNGPLEKVYAPIDTFTTYWQEQGEDPAKIAEELTGDRSAYASALRTGEDLVIPTATYAVKVAGTEHNAYFSNELRLAPDAMNAREAAAFVEEQKQAAEQARAEESAPEVSPTAPIRAALLQQLETAGVEKSTAAAYVDLYEATFANLGERAGIDPVKLFEQYGLQIARPELAAAPVKEPAAAAPVVEQPALAEQPADVPAAYEPVRDVLEAFPSIDVKTMKPSVVVDAYLAEVYGPNALGSAALRDSVLADTAKRTTTKGEQKVAILEWVRTFDKKLREEGGAAPRIKTAVPRSPNLAREIAMEAGPAGGKTPVYTGVERRGTENKGAAARQFDPDAPVNVMADPVAAAMRYRAEDPAIDLKAQAMRDKASAAGRIKEPEELRAQRKGAVLDKKSDEAQTNEGTEDAGAEQSPNRIVDKGRSPAGNRVAASDPGTGKRAEGRADKHLARVFGSVLESAQQLDPAVNPEELRAEFDYRVALVLDQQQLAAESGNSPHSILREIAARGGISLHEDAERASEIRQMFGGSTPAFGAVAGVRGVFRKPTRATSANKKGGGYGIDQILQDLQSDPAFAWIESIDMLLDQIDEAMRHSADKIEAAVLPGTEELRDAGIRREAQWWANPWRAVDLLEGDVDEREVAAGEEGDTSFDVTEFNHSLFDEFEALEEPKGDTLATGEKQPRLPGDAGAVREEERTAGEFDLPFTLTAPVAKPGKKNAGQTTLFHEGEELTRESVQAWASDMKAIAGPDLKSFVVNLTLDGDIALDMIIVSRGAQRAGLGSKMIRMLTRYADTHGRRLLLTPGQRDPVHGTTSRDRLVKFYKRFGFVENTGRNKDFSISAGMLREPTLPSFALTAPKDERAIPKTETGPSAEYTAAKTEADRVSAEFREATRRYRAQEIDDAEYLAARDADKAAQAAFDAAFEAEQTRLGHDEEAPKKQPRGTIRFGADRQFSIALLKDANLATFLHETGHFYLEVFTDLANMIARIPVNERTGQQQQALADHAALMEWLTDEDHTGAGFSVKQHEQFARGFEAYLLEGRAPSAALRQSFARFRAWLVGIYRSIKGLRVELTDDVRRILDRMVATDEAIARAEQEASVTPMFTSPAAAGMGPAEFELYRRTVQDASTAAREGLEVQLLAEVQREQEATWKAQRAELRDVVAAETHAMPVYQAIAAMQRGTHPDGSPLVEGLDTPPLKLSRKMLVDQFGADRLKRLPRPYIYSADGGMDPGVVAGMYGYSSADQMLKAIEEAEPMKARIERETDRRMLADHGSMLLDGTLQEKAQAAVANEQREKIIRAELGALGRLRRTAAPFVKAGQQAVDAEKAERDYERRWFEAEAKLRIAIAEGRKQVEIDALRAEVSDLKSKARGGAATINAAIPPADAVREAARVRIAGTKVRELRPDVFWSASRRAAQKAIDSAARQDFEGAIVAKGQELINLALFKEANRVKAEIDKRVQKAIDLARPAAQKRLGLAGETYLDQVNAILDQYDFARQTGKLLDRRESLRQWVAALQSQGLPVEIPDDVLDDARRIHYRELTVDELTGITDAIDHIVHLSRLKNKLLKSQAGRELQATATAIADSVREHYTGKRDKSIETRLPAESTARTLAGFFASHRKLASLARELDGFKDGGPMWESVIRVLNEAGNREAVMNADATRGLSELVQAAYPGRERVRLYDKVHIPAIGASLSKMGRIMVALNWGNEGNRQRIRGGYGWNDVQVQAILDTLDARDWKFIQGTWDFINGYWPEIAAKQKRVTGVEPAKVEAIVVKTRFGDFAGGYFPIKYDDRQSAQAGAHLDLEAGNLQKQAAYVKATTKRGHTEARVSKVTLPVRLDFGVLFEHVQQVIHDLSHHEMLIDVGRVLGHRDVQKAIYETYGDVVYRQFKDGLRDVAFGVVPAVTAFEKGINHLRSGATIAGLGWNLTTAMLQPLGLTQSMVRIGPKWVGRGLWRWTRDAASLENSVRFITERSEFMRLRGQTQQREINEIRNAVGVNTGKLSGWVDDVLKTTTLNTVSRQGVADSFFFLIQQMQRVADVPTWLGQYEKSMEAGESEARAIALADQAVLDAQGGGQVKDLAGVQRGGPLLKLWTNFYSFFNTTYNLTVESTRRTKFSKPGQVGRLAVDYLLLYTIPATLGYALRQALKPGDDDESLSEGLIRENLSYIMGTILGVRELSGTVQGYFGYEGPAGARAFATAARLLKQVEQGEADAAFWRALNDLAGILFHYPSGQTRRTIEGVAALAEGTTSNPGAVVVGAPSK